MLYCLTVNAFMSLLPLFQPFYWFYYCFWTDRLEKECPITRFVKVGLLFFVACGFLGMLYMSCVIINVDVI